MTAPRTVHRGEHQSFRTLRAGRLTLDGPLHPIPQSSATTLAYTPPIDEDRLPLNLGPIPERDREAALRVVNALARAATPAAFIFTPETVEGDLEWMKEAVREYLHELGVSVPDSEGLTPAHHRHALKLGYEGKNPFALEALIAQLRAAPPESDVLKRPGPLGAAMRETLALQAFTKTLKAKVSDTFGLEVMDVTGPWTPPLLTVTTSPDADANNLVNELHQEQYQYAMEYGYAQPTAVFDRRDRRERQHARALLMAYPVVKAGVLRVAHLLQQAGAVSE